MSGHGHLTTRKWMQAYLLAVFGDGQTAPCYHCGIQLRAYGQSTGPAPADLLTIDRILPGFLGGQYVPGNIRPACPWDNAHRTYAEYATGPVWPKPVDETVTAA